MRSLRYKTVILLKVFPYHLFALALKAKVFGNPTWLEFLFAVFCCIFSSLLTGTLKNALYLSVNLFSTKAIIGDIMFTSLSGDGTSILRGHPSHAKV